MARTVIDPVTRVGGHLRVEVDLSGGAVRDAWSSGTMFRGIELVMRGRDPRDAWMVAERICGTCTGVHALASVRAVEQALGITIPTNARLIRNILAATQAVRDHVVQLYLAQLPDWVDANAALLADPEATSLLARSLSPRPGSGAAAFRAVQARLADVASSGQAGPYTNGYWGHPAYQLSPEQDLLLLAHGLEALDWQRRLMRIHALLGGKDPHPQSYLVGGMAVAPDWGGPIGPGTHPPVPDRNAPAPLSPAGLRIVGDLLAEAVTFVDQVVIRDVIQLAKAYPDWATIGATGSGLMAFGEYPEADGPAPSLYLPRGRLALPSLAQAFPVQEQSIAETVVSSWYSHAAAEGAVRHPAQGETDPSYSGPEPPIQSLEGSATYTWLKAPRYNSLPMEVGPLARMLVAYVNGQPDVASWLGSTMSLAGLNPDGLPSTLGRMVTRAVEARILAERADGWLSELKANLSTGDLAIADLSSWDPSSWPASAEGWSLGESPRGAVGHWVGIANGAIDHYQVVDATTWNASPRDAIGVRGPMEAALVGTPVADPAQPLEILRTVHSFNPCVACAVHAAGRRGPVEVRLHQAEVRR